MNLNLKQVFAAILQWRTRDDQNERAEEDVVALPLTLQEVAAVTRCLRIACESERTHAGNRQTFGLIKERIVRFAERQGAWWDVEGKLVATVVKTVAARDVAK
jgi:hypothetical protein